MAWALTNWIGPRSKLSPSPTGESPDAQVVAIALRGTPSVSSAAHESALLRALADGDANVRRAALMSAVTIWNDAIEAKIHELAESDPDQDVKADARDVVARAMRE